MEKRTQGARKGEEPRVWVWQVEVVDLRDVHTDWLDTDWLAGLLAGWLTAGRQLG